jgi:hypothetical protein
MSAIVNLKLPEDDRVRFRESTRDQGLTMQAALQAFVNSYNNDPEKFKLIMEVRNGSV